MNLALLAIAMTTLVATAAALVVRAVQIVRTPVEARIVCARGCFPRAELHEDGR